jgi:hypothetical protein
MNSNSPKNEKAVGTSAQGMAASSDGTPPEDNKVGYGRAPKEHRFPPGTSGNPKGRPKKQLSIKLDLKLALEQALSNKIRLKQGERKRTVTMAIAGIEQLVAQFAKGDPRARRDVIALADKLDVDLIGGQQKAIREAAADASAAPSAYMLSEEVLERLSPATLDEIRETVEGLEAEKRDLKKMN